MHYMIYSVHSQHLEWETVLFKKENANGFLQLEKNEISYEHILEIMKVLGSIQSK